MVIANCVSVLEMNMCYMFQTYAEAYQEVATYIEFYNNRRIHSSILDLSPSEFYR